MTPRRIAINVRSWAPQPSMSAPRALQGSTRSRCFHAEILPERGPSRIAGRADVQTPNPTAPAGGGSRDPRMEASPSTSARVLGRAVRRGPARAWAGPTGAGPRPRRAWAPPPPGGECPPGGRGALRGPPGQGSTPVVTARYGSRRMGPRPAAIRWGYPGRTRRTASGRGGPGSPRGRRPDLAGEAFPARPRRLGVVIPIPFEERKRGSTCGRSGVG